MEKKIKRKKKENACVIFLITICYNVRALKCTLGVPVTAVFKFYLCKEVLLEQPECLLYEHFYDMKENMFAI
jgi:hypothetical protein